MSSIHPTAVVDQDARLGSGVEIGPYCVVGPHVELGEGTRLHSHVVLDGRTKIGPQTEIYPFASLGAPPQDLKYGGEESELLIGARNRDRKSTRLNSSH